MAMSKIKKNDIVKVITGRTEDRGRTGKVIWIDAKSNRVLVEGVNIRKKAMRKTQESPQGGIVEMAVPVHVSNVALINQKTNQPAKVGFKINETGKKLRFDKKTGDILDTEK